MFIYMALLQTRSTPINPWLPSPATLLFNRLTRGILPKFSRQVMLCDNDERNFIMFLGEQSQANQDINTCKNIPFLPTGSTVAVQGGDGGPWANGIIIVVVQMATIVKVTESRGPNRLCNKQNEKMLKTYQHICRRLSLE